jgi:mannose-6-phosphate isomerase
MIVPMAKPIFLPSNQFDHFYRGGGRIGTLRNGPGGPMRPEEWIGSVTTRFGENIIGLSQLPSGELLRDAISSDPYCWLGPTHFDAFGTSTEILVKLLDPNQRLPVHFHPNKAFAKRHLSLTHGKTEAWIILEAQEGARVGLGFSQIMTKDVVLKMVRGKDSASLLESLTLIPVKAGDSILVPAGAPHLIDAGIFLLELQEPTDLSAFLEWDGFAVDGEKDGHLGLGFDTVLDALRLEPFSHTEFGQLVRNTDLLSGERARSLFAASVDGYFRADLLPGDSTRICAGFSILLILAGSGFLKTTSSSEFLVNRGDAIVIPWGAGEWSLNGATGIVCRPPLPEAAKTAL